MTAMALALEVIATAETIVYFFQMYFLYQKYAPNNSACDADANAMFFSLSISAANTAMRWPARGGTSAAQATATLADARYLPRGALDTG